MSPAKGTQLWATVAGQWYPISLGKFADDGGAGELFDVTGIPTSRPLIAKIYTNEELIADNKADQTNVRRLLILAQEASTLAKDLPFVAWPTHVVFDTQALSASTAHQHLAGIVMAKEPDFVLLNDLTEVDAGKANRSMADIFHLAKTLAYQIDRLHAHRWAFIFGDFNSRNIAVSTDLTRVVFFDADSFQFTYRSDQAFPPIGNTEPFSSPFRDGPGMLTHARGVAHDHFVLAIHIFTLLMVRGKNEGLHHHPFTCLNHEVGRLIKDNIFPLDHLATYPINKNVVAVYAKLPDYIRDAFTKTFALAQPLTADEWLQLLSRYAKDPNPSASTTPLKVTAPRPRPQPSARATTPPPQGQHAAPAKPAPVSAPARPLVAAVPQPKPAAPAAVAPNPPPRPAPPPPPAPVVLAPPGPAPLSRPAPTKSLLALFALMLVTGALLRRDNHPEPPAVVAAPVPTHPSAPVSPQPPATAAVPPPEPVVDPARWDAVRKRLKDHGLLSSAPGTTLVTQTDVALQHLTSLLAITRPNDPDAAHAAINELERRIFQGKAWGEKFPIPRNPSPLLLAAFDLVDLMHLASLIPRVPLGKTATVLVGHFDVDISRKLDTSNRPHCSSITYVVQVPSFPLRAKLNHCQNFTDSAQFPTVPPWDDPPDESSLARMLGFPPRRTQRPSP